MAELRVPNWNANCVPVVSIFAPEAGVGREEVIFWAAQLEASGIPFRRAWLPRDDSGLVIVPTRAVDRPLASLIRDDVEHGRHVLLSGERTPPTAELIDGGTSSSDRALERARNDLSGRLAACAPARSDAPVASVRMPADGYGAVGWFGTSAGTIDWRTREAAVTTAEWLLEQTAADGLVALSRWPNGARWALVVDGDVDHPTGVDPECSRYVAPSWETMRRAGFASYGIFAAAVNVDAEPHSFPALGDYYNHSYTHPYSHWDARSWADLDADEIEEQLRRSNETFVRHFGRNDGAVFRLPHFQHEGWNETALALERLRYVAESSVGANWSITAGLPYHPTRDGDRPFATTDPDDSGRVPFLQLPISTDPSDPGFPHGCCSYNALGEGVRNRSAHPSDYEALLDDVVRRAAVRRGLAHLFVDPPDAGYGRLDGDRVNYAAAVERWLRRCVERGDGAVLTTAELATWWLERERAASETRVAVDAGSLRVGVPPASGRTLAIRRPCDAGEAVDWEVFPVGPSASPASGAMSSAGREEDGP